MLKRFRVNNFKNLINVEFRPVGVNLLVGRNNAGKTNLCQAMHFFALASRMALKEAAQLVVGEVWNVTNVHQPSRLIEFEVKALLGAGDQSGEFNYRLALEVETHPVTAVQTLKVNAEELRLSQAGQERLLLENRGGVAGVLDETGATASGTLKARIPEGHTALSKLFDEQAHPSCILFRKYLSHWAYFGLNPMALRSSRVAGSFPLITPQGENLGPFLSTLQNQMPRVARSVLAALQGIEPQAEFFTFSHPDPEHTLWFIEDQQGHRFGVQHLSDGTLRYLALCCVIVGLQESPDAFHPPPLVMVEEPENGLHVGELKPLVERIEPDGQSGQFLFTSHSPYLIDLWDANLEGIHVLKPGRPTSVLVRPDPEKLRPLLDQMPLGELHFRELLA